MNVRQALQHLFPTLEARYIYEQAPDPTPPGMFLVVSELTDGRDRQLLVQVDGHAPQARTLTLLVTLYGKELGKLDDLRAPFATMRRNLPDLITDHPGVSGVRGCLLGAVLPPTPDRDGKRPFAGLHLQLRYLE